METIKSEIIEEAKDAKDNLCLDIFYEAEINLYKVVLHDSRRTHTSDWKDSSVPRFEPYIDDRTYDYRKVISTCINTIENHKKLIKSSSVKSPTKVEEVEDDEEDIGFDTDKKILKIKITDIYNPEKEDMTLTSSGVYKMECPDCGMQGGRTLGFIIFPKTNSAFCQSSQKWFKLLEAYALKKKIVRCMDGRDKGGEDKDRKVLGGELWTQTLLEFKEEFGIEKYNDLCEDWNIRKKIYIPGKFRLASNFADDVARVFGSRNLLFNRAESGDIIKIKTTRKIDKDNNDRLITMERGFEILSDKEFVTMLELYVDPYLKTYYKDGTSQEAPLSITKATSEITLASANFKFKMPTLERIFDIQIPIVYKGKLTFPKRGYDRRFGSYLPPNAPKIKQDVYTVEQARVFIEKIFEEFCFKDKKDFIHAIAAFLTPFCRGLFPKFSTRTPVFIYMANRERAGKDYLAGCTGMLYEGVATEQPPISTDEKGGFGSNNEELRKKITSCMIEGKKRFHSSNNKGLLNNSVLESATTLDVWEDRVLGQNKTINYPNEMEYSLSGNIGMSLTPDLVNRARVVDLYLVIEDANSRTFKNPRLHAWILENREAIISALFTIVKHWWDNGAKPGKEPFTSFPEWATIVGGIMESVNWDNPCTKDNVTVIALDQETDEMKMLYETVYEQKPNIWLTPDELKEIIEKESIMPDLDFKDKADKQKFGRILAKYGDRILSDITMKVRTNRKSERNKYRFVKPLLNLDDLTPENNENDEKVGQVGGFGEMSQSSYVMGYPDKYSGQDIPPLPPTCPTPGEPGATPNINKLSETLINQSTLVDLKFQPLSSFTKIMDDAKQKDLEKKKKKKTGRELQYWEDPQCAGIVDQCTKEQTLEWIKNNPNVKYKVMRKELGLGASRFVVELVREGLVKRVTEGWEITNAIQG